MVDRARLRVGRPVAYNPTAAEAAASGEGPWPAMITDVDADGAVDLLCHIPGDALGAGITQVPAAVAAVAAGTPTTPSGVGYVQAESTAMADALIEIHALLLTYRALINSLRQHALDTRKNAVTRGGGPGQYDFVGDGVGANDV